MRWARSPRKDTYMASTEIADTAAASGPAASAASRPSQVDMDPQPQPPTTVHGPTGGYVDRWSVVAALITEFVRNARTQP